MKEKDNIKICLTASAGGHMSELLQLKQVWEGVPHFFVTTGHIVTKKYISNTKTYIVKWSNRRHPLLLVKMTVQCFLIMINEQPNVILSTGAAVGCILCIIGKLMGRKIVWIDSICYVDTLSLSGKIINLLLIYSLFNGQN